MLPRLERQLSMVLTEMHGELDCEATPRAGVTLTTVNLTCHLTLQMSPTEA